MISPVTGEHVGTIPLPVQAITGGAEDDLLRIADDDKLGLQGAVFTRSIDPAVPAEPPG